MLITSARKQKRIYLIFVKTASLCLMMIPGTMMKMAQSMT